MRAHPVTIDDAQFVVVVVNDFVVVAAVVKFEQGGTTKTAFADDDDDNAAAADRQLIASERAEIYVTRCEQGRERTALQLVDAEKRDDEEQVSSWIKQSKGQRCYILVTKPGI